MLVFFERVFKMLQSCVKGVLEIFQGGLKVVSDYFKGIQRPI